MWLRDALPHDIPRARVLTYGYDTRLSDTNSFQNLEDVALRFALLLGPLWATDRLIDP